MKNTKERYYDYKSTAYLFVPFGIIGILYTVVDYFDIWKKVNFITSLFQFIVAITLFVIFILIGISSYLTARSILKKIPIEDDLIEKINNYLAETLTSDYVSKLCGNNNTSEHDAEMYYLVVNTVTEQAKLVFPQASEELINDLVENYYNDNF